MTTASIALSGVERPSRSFIIRRGRAAHVPVEPTPGKQRNGAAHLPCPLQTAGRRGGIRWHQDSDHRRYGTDQWTDVNGRGSFVQTLMAVDVMNEENGPLMVVPGSGRQGHQYLKQNPSPLDALFDGRAQPVLMEARLGALLGPYTVHGSKPNRSKHARRVFINGYGYPGANRRIYPGKGAGRKVVARP